MNEEIWTTKEVEKLPAQKYVCLFLDDKQKRHLCFIELPEDGVLNLDAGWISWKIRAKVDMLKARPGSLWAVPVLETEGGTEVFLGHGEYSGQWNEDAAMLTTIWAKHRTAELKWKMETKRSKAMNDDVLQDALAPIRLAYASLTWRDRRIFLAYVIQNITG